VIYPPFLQKGKRRSLAIYCHLVSTAWWNTHRADDQKKGFSK